MYGLLLPSLQGLLCSLNLKQKKSARDNMAFLDKVQEKYGQMAN